MGTMGTRKQSNRLASPVTTRHLVDESVMQQLESRTLLAGDPLGIGFSRGVLTVTGTANDDAIVVSRAGSVWTIANGSWSSTRTLAVSKLVVNAKAGNDAVTVDPSVLIPATLLGDLGNDTLVASNGATYLHGGAGNDSLTGGNANDVLVGDVGNDVLNAGAGNNKMSGGSGDDHLTAGAGNDVIAGDAGNDTLVGGEGNNTLNGGLGDDSLESGAGNDSLIGDVGNDVLVAGEGNNRLIGGAGSDLLSAGAGNDYLQGDADHDTLSAGDGANTLAGGLGNDSLTGGSGNDFVQGGLGNDTLVGGAGTDTLDYSTHTVLQSVTVSLADGTGGMIGETDSLASDFEILRGGAGHDRLTGSDADDLIYGNSGNDTIVGLGGNDKLYGNAGNDSLVGGADNDSLYGGAGNDALLGDAGDDLLISLGGGLLDSVTGGDGADTFWSDLGLTELLLDASSDELAIGAVHRVSTFANKASKELDGQAIADPILKGSTVRYRNFKTSPLFSSAGPGIDDVTQGQLGDCYFLAQIGSFAKLDQDIIRQAIVDFGDGTYGVQFVRGASKLFYRIDADLPSYTPTRLAYAAFGAEGSTWVALMEKAWALFRKGKNSFASIEGGFMTEVAAAFGKSNTWGFSSSSNPNGVLAMLKGELDAGRSVTIGTNGAQLAGSLMVGGHAYSVESIVEDGSGGYTVTLRNPWAIDGYTTADGQQDGYVTLSSAQFGACVNAYAISAA